MNKDIIGPKGHDTMKQEKRTKIVWPSDDEYCKPKTNKKDRPFKIEYYFKYSWGNDKGWYTWKTYSSEKGRDDAFERLKQKVDDNIKRYNSPVHRYRKLDLEGNILEETRNQ